MMNKGNVIDMTARRRAQVKGVESESKPAREEEPSTAVLDMTERRNEMLLQERRQVRRTILSEFIGAFAVIPGQGLCRVTIYDISENGVAFDLEQSAGHFEEGEEVAMRVYMNRTTYFPFVVQVQNIRDVTDEGMHRHGANFVKGTVNDLALHHFIKFIENVSASLRQDNGDVVMVSNLNE